MFLMMVVTLDLFSPERSSAGTRYFCINIFKISNAFSSNGARGSLIDLGSYSALILVSGKSS